MKKLLYFGIILGVIFIIAGIFFYFHYQAYNGNSNIKKAMDFEIEKGESVDSIASRLASENLTVGKWYFIYYVKANKLDDKILPGKYELNSELKIPEIVAIIIDEEKALPDYVKITFPEGWTIQKMADRLTANNFDGAEFLKIAKNPPSAITNKYLYPEDNNITSLEGYLFPDTYFLKPGTSAEVIIGKMLENFNLRITRPMRDEIKSQGKTLRDIIIMASIIEREVVNEDDRAIVSGIFWIRLKIGQPLQSCATLSFILGVNKKQYSFEDTRTDSPYNTYLNQGLPPGPIGNPGLASIRAAIYPKDSDYNYFLSDLETGQTIFSGNLEEHNSNKVKYGL
jgi:UPF0755 protein